MQQRKAFLPSRYGVPARRMRCHISIFVLGIMYTILLVANLACISGKSFSLVLVVVLGSKYFVSLIKT